MLRISAIFTVFFAIVGTVAAQQAPALTTLSGVYTESQAEAGEKEFAVYCSKCHEGECPEGPPLSMNIFTERWREESLGFLFGFLRTRMPAKAKGSLSETSYLQILSYLLKLNNFPAGKNELTVASLEKIRFVDKDGPRALPTNSLVHVAGCVIEDPVTGWTLSGAGEPARADRPPRRPGSRRSCAPAAGC